MKLFPNRLLPLALLALAVACGKSAEPETAAPPATAKERKVAARPEPEAAGKAASGSDVADSPEAVTREFFEAGMAEDEARMERTMTAGAWKGLSGGDEDEEGGGGGFDLSGGKVESFELGEATTEGVEAKVAVSIVDNGEAQDMKMLLRREDGRWGIYGAEISMGDGMNMTIDFEEFGAMMEEMASGLAEAMSAGFEDAFSGWEPGGTAEEIARDREMFAALEPLSVEDYEKSWRMDLNFTDRPAGEVLTELLVPMGLLLDTEGAEDALAKMISVKAPGISRLEAVERVCAAAGVWPMYPDPHSMSNMGGELAGALVNGLASMMGMEPDAAMAELEGELGAAGENFTVRLVEGERPWPVTHAGPFVLIVTGVNEEAPEPKGSVQFEVRSYGLPPALLTAMSEQNGIIQVAEILSPAGESIRADDGTSFFGSPMITPVSSYEYMSLDLVRLLRGVEAVGRLAGTASLSIPTEVHAVDFKNAGPGDSATVGGMTVTLKEVGEMTEIEVKGEGVSFESLQAKIICEDAEGVAMGNMGAGSMGWGDQVTLSLNTARPPKNITLKLIGASEPVRYEWAFPPIPLKRFSEMPETLEVLDFGDLPAPVSAEFGEFTDRDPDFPKVRIRLTNHSNKDALSIAATFVYLDAEGNAIKDFPHTIQGEFGFDGHAPAVKKGSRSQPEVTAFFMPEETKSIRVEISEVEFSDATEWSAPGSE